MIPASYATFLPSNPHKCVNGECQFLMRFLGSWVLNNIKYFRLFLSITKIRFHKSFKASELKHKHALLEALVKFIHNH